MKCCCLKGNTETENQHLVARFVFSRNRYSYIKHEQCCKIHMLTDKTKRKQKAEMSNTQQLKRFGVVFISPDKSNSLDYNYNFRTCRGPVFIAIEVLAQVYSSSVVLM